MKRKTRQDQPIICSTYNLRKRNLKNEISAAQRNANGRNNRIYSKCQQEKSAQARKSGVQGTSSMNTTRKSSVKNKRKPFHKNIVSKNNRSETTLEENGVTLKLHHVESDDIRSVCWLSSQRGEPSYEPYFLYVMDGHLHLMSLLGEPRPLPKGLPSDADDIINISVSSDYGWLALVHGQSRHGFWWSVYSRNRENWTLFGDYKLEEVNEPPNLAWTHSGEVVISDQFGNLSMYMADGRLWWKHGQPDTKCKEPQMLTTATDGQIYVTSRNSNCITAFDIPYQESPLSC